MSQLSQVYSSITVANLLALVVPLKDAGVEGAYDEEQIEAYVMGCARRGELNIRVDHAAGSITFVDNAFVAADEPPPSAGVPGTVRESAIQPSTSELVRTRLNKLATCLHNSLVTLQQHPSTASSAEEQQANFEAVVIAAEAERKALQLRRALVARRRELLSELSVRKEKEETSRRAEISRREKEEEGKRAKEELKRKEQERTKKIIETNRIDEAKRYAQSLVDKGILKPNDVDVSILQLCNSQKWSLIFVTEIGDLRHRRSYCHPSCAA